MVPRLRPATDRDPASLPRVASFPPLVGAGARVLVVGSMPGVASLRAQQYYAHRQNAFWPAMAAICGAGPELDYDARVRTLVAAGIAVWDVLQQCVRAGSLDAAIEREGLVANDFATFLRAHRGIAAVFCNGATAATCWRRYVAPQLVGMPRSIPVVALPSTSPAHASLSRAAKIARWHAAVSPWLPS